MIEKEKYKRKLTWGMKTFGFRVEIIGIALKSRRKEVLKNSLKPIGTVRYKIWFLTSKRCFI